jgi:hypothetical protein
MDALAQIVAWLNVPANALGRFLLAPIAVLPGWLSATIVSAATGLLLLVVFKYTSNQRAIGRVRDDIKAHLLALKLFRDSTSVTFRAQGRILLGAFRLMVLAIVPMLVMVVPVCLLLGQLALWYQSRPLKIGEEAVVTVKLRDQPGGRYPNGVAAAQAAILQPTLRGGRDGLAIPGTRRPELGGGRDGPAVPGTRAGAAWPDVRLEPTSAVEVTVGPVRVLSKREICWNLKARENGYHRAVFLVDQQASDKELAIGDGFMRLAAKRPGWSWSEVLLHPGERPFRPDAAVESIEIDYPHRASWTSGTDWWVAYWFVMSMVAALCFRPWMKVSI